MLCGSVNKKNDAVCREGESKLQHLLLCFLTAVGKKQQWNITVCSQLSNDIIDEEGIMRIVSMLNDDRNHVTLSGTKGRGKIVTDIAELVRCLLNGVQGLAGNTRIVAQGQRYRVDRTATMLSNSF